MYNGEMIKAILFLLGFALLVFVGVISTVLFDEFLMRHDLKKYWNTTWMWLWAIAGVGSVLLTLLVSILAAVYFFLFMMIWIVNGWPRG